MATEVPIPSRRRWLRSRLALVLLWAGMIFATSSTVISVDELYSIVRSIFGQKALDRFEIFWGIAWFAVVKGWHATEFAILTAVLIAFLNTRRPSRRKGNALLAGLIAAVFAITDEFHQTFVPTREGTILDVLIDCVGVCAVTAVCWTRARKTESVSAPQL
jgi:hypothetical protein